MTTIECERFVVVMERDGDPRAVGGAVTLELCGAIDHPPPCTWPHHTQVEPAPAGSEFSGEVVYCCGAEEVEQVRRRIVAALAGGRYDGPEGRSRWTFVRSAASEPSDEQRAAMAEHC